MPFHCLSGRWRALRFFGMTRSYKRGPCFSPRSVLSLQPPSSRQDSPSPLSRSYLGLHGPVSRPHEAPPVPLNCPHSSLLGPACPSTPWLQSRMPLAPTLRAKAVMAVLARLRGREMEGNAACRHCRSSNGPFGSCVVLTDDNDVRYMNGSCANCHYNGSGTRCDFRKFSP